jgi:tripartite-type tricarboxylate transporter receptor subunit TctC
MPNDGGRRLSARSRLLPLFLPLAAAAVLALAASSGPAAAQDYPSRPITLVVPLGAGGAMDIIVRTMAPKLAARLGKAVLVEDRPGAGTVLAANDVARGTPDGYTLLISPSGTLTTNVTLYKKLSYDPVKDFVPVALYCKVPFVLVSDPSMPFRTVAELIAYAKANPGAVNMGSPSAGTPPYLAVELLKMMAGVNVVHVPYLGESQMVTDLLGGQLKAGIGGISSGIGHIKAGTLRALGVTTPARMSELPDVPTIGETIAGFEASGWSGFVGPKNLPKDIVDKIAAAVSAAQADPKFKERLTDLGAPLFTLSPDAFGQFIVAETEKWGKVVKFAGLKPQ